MEQLGELGFWMWGIAGTVMGSYFSSKEAVLLFSIHVLAHC